MKQSGGRIPRSKVFHFLDVLLDLGLQYRASSCFQSSVSGALWTALPPSVSVLAMAVIGCESNIFSAVW